MDEETPWEPPVAGTEAEHLVGALDRLRWTFRWKADGLDDAGLAVAVGTSSLTIGGLLAHLAVVEEHASTVRLDGSDGPAWQDHDRAFVDAPTVGADDLYARWDGAVSRSRERFAAAIAAGGLDQPIALTWPDGSRPSLRRLLCDLIEEYGRHTGHADLIRESIDDRVGEDPPPGWRPAASDRP